MSSRYANYGFCTLLPWASFAISSRQANVKSDVTKQSETLSCREDLVNGFGRFWPCQDQKLADILVSL